MFSETGIIENRSKERLESRKNYWSKKEDVLAIEEKTLVELNLADTEILKLELDGLQIVAEKLFSKQEGENTIWSGKMTGIPGTVVLVQNIEDGLSGSVIMDDRAENYQIEAIDRSVHIIVRRKQAKGGDDTPWNDTAESFAKTSGYAPPIAGGAAANNKKVRLLFVYTAAAKNASPNITTRITTAVQEVNTFLLNQGIYIVNGGSQSFSVTNRYSAQVSYSEGTGANNNYLTHITNLKNNQVGNTLSLRNTYGADITVLIVNGLGWNPAAGVNNVLGSVGVGDIPANSANQAFLVISQSALTGEVTLAHEIAHLFGGKHFDDTQTTTGLTYARGFRLAPINRKTIIAGGAVPGDYITMWSDDTQLFQGSPLGTANHDMVRGLKQYNATVAAFKSDPIINVSISGPTTLASGQNGTWTANVSGGGTQYPCRAWYSRPSSSSTWSHEATYCNGVKNFTDYFYQTTYLKVVATDDDGQAAENTWYVSIGGGYKSDITDLGTLEELPDITELHQNYPNPFNPSTSISYSISKEAFVNISIYDVLGRTVEVLVDQKQTAGYYSVPWEAIGLPGGVYFITLKTSDFVVTKQMTLLK